MKWLTSYMCEPGPNGNAATAATAADGEEVGNGADVDSAAEEAEA